MEQYISKSAVLELIKKRYEYWREKEHSSHSIESEARMSECQHLLLLLNTLEVKEVDTWHLQEKENIYNAVKDWGHHTFACIMKDGTIQRFNGCLDEDCEGHINAHIDGVNDDYDNVDDIERWKDITKEIK